MTDITKADLQVPSGNANGWPLTRKVTDEEFDRLAREWLRGGSYGQYLAFTMQWIRDNPDKALRALLTDECDCVGWGQGAFRNAEPHEVCNGRGWLPKDGVWQWNVGGEFDNDPTISFPADWLEADNE